MKTVLLLTTLITAVPAARATPLLYSSCHSSTPVKNVPPNVRYEFNQDCTELYVLPPDVAADRVRAVAQPAPDLPAVCERITANQKEQTETLEALNRVMRQAADAELSGEGLAKMRTQLDATNKTMREKTEELRTLAQQTGSVIRFTLSSGQAEAVATIQKENPDLRVTAMPFTRSFLSIFAVRPEDLVPERMPAILATSFDDDGPGDAASSTRAFHEGMSARVTLSPMGACGTGYDHFFPATLTYVYMIEVLGRLEERVGTSAL